MGVTLCIAWNWRRAATRARSPLPRVVLSSAPFFPIDSGRRSLPRGWRLGALPQSSSPAALRRAAPPLPPSTASLGPTLPPLFAGELRVAPPVPLSCPKSPSSRVDGVEVQERGTRDAILKKYGTIRVYPFGSIF
jgi:hypothetical protein